MMLGGIEDASRVLSFCFYALANALVSRLQMSLLAGLLNVLFGGSEVDSLNECEIRSEGSDCGLKMNDSD